MLPAHLSTQKANAWTTEHGAATLVPCLCRSPFGLPQNSVFTLCLEEYPFGGPFLEMGINLRKVANFDYRLTPTHPKVNSGSAPCQTCLQICASQSSKCGSASSFHPSIHKPVRVHGAVLFLSVRGMMVPGCRNWGDCAI